MNNPIAEDFLAALTAFQTAVGTHGNPLETPEDVRIRLLADHAFCFLEAHAINKRHMFSLPPGKPQRLAA